MTKLEYKTIMTLIDTCVDTKICTNGSYHYSCNADKLKAAIQNIYEEELEEEELSNEIAEGE